MDIFDINTRKEYLENKENIDINKLNKRYRNAIEMALYEKKFDKVIWLIEEGFKLKKENESYKEGIMMNCDFSQRCMKLTQEYPDLQKYLIDKGLKTEPVEHFKMTDNPIIFHSADVEVLKILLDKGHPFEWNSSLFSCVQKIIHKIRPNPEIIHFITEELKLDINEKEDKTGNTFLFYDKNLSENNLKEYIKMGFDINQENENLRTALFSASLEKTKILISAGININHVDIYNKNALGYVRDKEVALFLIDNGINTEIEDLLENLKIESPNHELYLFVKSYIEKKKIVNNLDSENIKEKIGNNNIKKRI